MSSTAIKPRPVFKLMLVVFVVALLLLLVATGMELAARYRYVQIAKTNKMLMDEHSENMFMCQGFANSFWATPYWEYYPLQCYRPGLPGHLNAIFQTNSLGWRSHEIVLPKPKNVYRILCVGGSTTFEGWANDTTYPELLEKKLRDYFHTDAIEVINCGISGMTAESERRKLPEYFRLEPDLILEYNGANDISYRLFSQLRERMSFFQKVLRNSEWVRENFCEALLPSDTTIRETFQAETFAHLEEVIRRAKYQQVEIVFSEFLSPDLTRISPEERDYYDYNIRVWDGLYYKISGYCCMVALYNELLHKLCDSKGVTCLPIAADFASRQGDFVDICHLTEAGIQRKTEVIFKHFRSYLAPRLKERLGIEIPAEEKP